MNTSEFAELESLIASRRVGDRVAAMDRISVRSGRQVVSLVDDNRAVGLLLRGLEDTNRRVQRAAARGLRPWVARDPSLLETTLAVYATDTFDGSFSHAGLLDTRTGRVWVPRFQATKGHAALLADGNTDRYFKFEFFVPGQIPGWIPDGEGDAHLLLYLIPEWSYARQELTSDFDERGLKRNLREQERFGKAVRAFYRGQRLPYAVRVHYVHGGGGHHRRREPDVARIERED